MWSRGGGAAVGYNNVLRSYPVTHTQSVFNKDLKGETMQTIIGLQLMIDFII